MKRLAPAIVMLIAVASPLYAGVPIAVTPEPATVALMAAGLGALGVGAWFRSRRGR